MSDFFFVLKTLIITVVVVLFMQIRIGPASIEQHALTWIENSTVVAQLRGVADGAIKLGGDGYQFVSATVNHAVGQQASFGGGSAVRTPSTAAGARAHHFDGSHRKPYDRDTSAAAGGSENSSSLKAPTDDEID